MGKFLARRKQDDFLGVFYEISSCNTEKGETIYKTLVRELKKETNFDITSVISYVNFF